MRVQLLMIIGSGLFAVGTLAAAVRSPKWLGMSLADFKRDFARTIAIADKVQPSLLVVTLIAIVGSVIGSDDPGERYAIGSGAALVIVLLLSTTILVPLQKRIIHKTESQAITDTLRMRWMKGHLGRCGVAIAAFCLAVGALVT